MESFKKILRTPSAFVLVITAIIALIGVIIQGKYNEEIAFIPINATSTAEARLTQSASISLSAIPSISPTPTQNIMEETVTVSANIGWQNLNIQVEKGNQVSIEYIEGTWNVGANSRFTDGSGYEANIHSDIVENAKYASLLAKIGSGDPFEVGNKIDFSANESGYLFFQINDGILQDNEGKLVIKIVITK